MGDDLKLYAILAADALLAGLVCSLWLGSKTTLVIGAVVAALVFALVVFAGLKMVIEG